MTDRERKAQVWADYFERCREQGRKEARKAMREVSKHELDLYDEMMDAVDRIVTKRNIMRTEWSDGDWRLVLKVTGEQIDELERIRDKINAYELRTGNGS